MLIINLSPELIKRYFCQFVNNSFGDRLIKSGCGLIISGDRLNTSLYLKSRFLKSVSLNK